jgi:dsRNA-specific ribonuclease
MLLNGLLKYTVRSISASQSKQSLIYIVANQFYGSGKASSKKAAQELAAEETLTKL